MKEKNNDSSRQNRDASPHAVVHFDAWPPEDRRRWNVAVCPADILDDAPGSRLADATKLWRRREYSLFLGFVREHSPHLLTRIPEERCTRDMLAAFIQVRARSCSPITQSIQLDMLRYTLAMLCPTVDWRWIGQIARRIKKQGRPKRKPHITSEQLYQLGICLMDAVLDGPERGGYFGFRDAIQFRDGLIIALLADAPMRSRAYVALRIGLHLARSGEAWSLDIPAADMKTKEPIEYPISPVLVTYLQSYLETYRRRIPGADRHDWLWPSASGGQLSAISLLNAVKKRTRKAFGSPITVQAFRRAAATLWAERDPKNVQGSADLLGHASLRMTERHYNMARCRLAGRAGAFVIDEIKREVGSRARARRRP
jgi:integrase